MDGQPATARELFETLSDRFRTDQAGNLNATIQFDLDGAGGGAWHIQVANQKLTVFEGQAPNPSLSVDMPASDFVLMMHGQLNPMSEFMSGKLKLRGDMSLAMQLLSWFKPK